MPRTRSGHTTETTIPVIAEALTASMAMSTRTSHSSYARTPASPSPHANTNTQPRQKKRQRCEIPEGVGDPDRESNTPLDSASNQNRPDDIDLTDLPTIDNFRDESTLQKWPPSRCREALAFLRPTCNKSASAHDKAEISSISRRYQHHLMLVALASKLTLQTVHREVGQTSNSRAHSAYVNYLEFSNKSHAEPMPQPNSQDPEAAEALITRNKVVGRSWKALSTDEQAVFSSHLLHALAGIPNHRELMDNALDHDNLDPENLAPVPEVVKLTDAEEQLYRPIYHRLVNHHLVVERLGSHTLGPSDGQVTQKALRCVLKHQESLRGDANRHPFDYWMVVSSNLPVMSPKDPSWCRVFTSLPVMTTYVTNKASFPFMFASVSQGAAILNAVGQATGTTLISAPAAPPPSARVRSCDLEKKRVRSIVTNLLIKVLGHKPSQGLPQGEDPAQEFIARRVLVRMALEPGASLTATDLKKGFIGMGVHGRRKWASDVEAGLFHFVLDKSIIPHEDDPPTRSRGKVWRAEREPSPDQTPSDDSTSSLDEEFRTRSSSDHSSVSDDNDSDSNGSNQDFEEFHGCADDE